MDATDKIMTDYILKGYGDNLLHYYKVLSKTGRTHKPEPFRFLIVGFLDELMNSSMAPYITECDYKAVGKILDNAMGTCLMPYNDWKNSWKVNEHDQIAGFTISTEDRQTLLAPEFFTQVYITE